MQMQKKKLHNENVKQYIIVLYENKNKCYLKPKQFWLMVAY